MAATRDFSMGGVVLGVVSNRCPRCFDGGVWKNLWSMRHACPSCGLPFVREPGYFTAAMVWSYMLGAIIALPVFFVLAVKNTPIWLNLLVPVAVLAVLAPFLVRFSRLALLHTDPTPFEEFDSKERRPA